MGEGQVDEREVIVSVSVGASVFPDHESDAEALLRAADAALFRAKALGRSQLATYTPELVATASAKFAIEQRLRRAIQSDEFELFYQPLVNTETLDVELVEALIRCVAINVSARQFLDYRFVGRLEALLQ